jgi:hypothetical protein
MRDSPVNRLEPHWLRASSRPAPVRPQYEPPSFGEAAKSWEKRVEDFMGEHPKLTVVAAATIGLVLGWMVKRK